MKFALSAEFPVMATQLRERVPPRIVEACASGIGDPVIRLRFLRVAMGSVEPPPRRAANRRIVVGMVILAGLLIPLAPARRVNSPERPARPAAAVQPPERSAPKVWLVEESGGNELYSNGLRIEGGPGVPGRPRLYRAFERSAPDGSRWVWKAEPAGIVFHSSESDVASFEPEKNGLLKRQGEQLLAYARRRQCYHFIIDRFGRVHRVVEETAKADHAGHSIWADGDRVYVNLNHSFLGICFEAQTRPPAAVSPAQVHSAKVLTEMLRSRYGIRARNCVTHAQVSVNPRNFRIGYHTDWANGFPYAGTGLPNNYLQPPPSLTFYGFDADSSYIELAGTDLRDAVALAREQVRQAAESRNTPVARYLAELHESYTRAAAAAGSSAVQ
jgi:hypothetical protein